MARSIIASALHEVAREQSVRTEHARISTGLQSIDTALNGGLERGRVTCLSGEGGPDKSTITLRVLVSYLVSKPTSQAAFIDTTGTFDVFRLQQAIAEHLRTFQAGRGMASTYDLPLDNPNSDSQANAEAQIERVLDRVKIMRVFDFVGIREAINELRESMEHGVTGNAAVTSRPADNFRNSGIADSQADEDDEDVMLFDSQDESENAQPNLDSVGLIVIDNVTSAINPVLKADYVQGRALLAAFMRSLSRLTKVSNITTILLNSTEPVRSNVRVNWDNNSIKDDSEAPPSMNAIAVPEKGHDSVFASTTLRPSLGRILTDLTDCHILLSKISKTRKDAEILIGGKAGHGETVNIIEVLSHRSDSGIGRWAAFDLSTEDTRIHWRS